MAITRTFTHNVDLTPQELASAFTDMDAGQQAAFFAEVWTIARAWLGAGWCQQSYAIAEKLNTDGRNTITTLAAHLTEDF